MRNIEGTFTHTGWGDVVDLPSCLSLPQPFLALFCYSPHLLAARKDAHFLGSPSKALACSNISDSAIFVRRNFRALRRFLVRDLDVCLRYGQRIDSDM